ncbi:MAG TPA: ABC transporter ATP-binding protein [Opitutaceae bacterium]|nr:ABC transporter ATP-binding protein [Opitutaceae bacterium]
MSSSPAASTATGSLVSLRGVGKTYAIWDDPSARLMAPLRRLWDGRSSGPRTFTALRDVNLEIGRGECVGVIGRNGAGKSTLLQIIAGTLRPSAGEVAVAGRVAALLELGSGFNPEFTGRENIHLNASILGLSPAEIDAKFERIVAYSGIEEFIDRPVRTYSSGMSLRLAFAVCVHVDADLFIIDEALAVGDARFQLKCYTTLEQMLQEGRTIIFVSHDTNSVKRMCHSAILLERGEVLLRGTPNDVTNVYTKLITSPLGVEAIRDDLAALRQGPVPAPPAPPSTPPPPSMAEPLTAAIRLVADERAHQQVSDKEYSYGGDLGRIEFVALLDERDQPRLSFLSGSRIRVRLACTAGEAEIPDPIYALTIKDVRGQEIFGTNTWFQGLTPPAVPARGTAEVTFAIDLNVLPGVYFISLGWVRLVDGEVSVIQRRYDVFRFDVLPRDKSFGLAYCPTTISVRPG